MNYRINIDTFNPNISVKSLNNSMGDEELRKATKCGWKLRKQVEYCAEKLFLSDSNTFFFSFQLYNQTPKDLQLAKVIHQYRMSSNIGLVRSCDQWPGHFGVVMCLLFERVFKFWLWESISYIGLVLTPGPGTRCVRGVSRVSRRTLKNSFPWLQSRVSDWGLFLLYRAYIPNWSSCTQD